MRDDLSAIARKWRANYQVGDRRVVGLSDGVFVMSEGFMNRPGFHHQFDNNQGVAELPVAAFVVPGDSTVLIDAGSGPCEKASLRGGALLDELEAVGIRPTGIDVLAISHLHLDHDGWIADATGAPVFPNATIRVGVGDWEHFVAKDDAFIPEQMRMAPHLKEGLKALSTAGRVELVHDAGEIAPGVVALPTPGHTPGHLIFAVVDHGERLLILGDSMYCPAQLTDADLSAVHDIDPVLAKRSRELIQREMENHATSAVGCHFPGLSAARVVGGTTFVI
jgi:glyoxylase-like metal-dependent hydrolase (beta-lactamase superfamily II)